MSDVNGLVVTDVLGLAQPLQKLIKTVAIGVGKVYEPTYIRRMAKAKADEIQIISDSINKNIALPIHYEDGSICITAEDANELARRAQNRALYQEMKKQQNIESVIGKAYDELSTVSEVSDTPVDSDWVSEFFDNVANVSNEKMQILWGKLLAGEIKQPGSFSLRTLSTLKNMSQIDADFFNDIIPYILKCRGSKDGSVIDYFLLSNSQKKLLERRDIPFSKIMRLSEAGLISSSSTAGIQSIIKPGESELIDGIFKTIQMKNIGNKSVTLSHIAYFLTEAGIELFGIALHCENEQDSNNYLEECMQELKETGFDNPFELEPHKNIGVEIELI